MFTREAMHSLATAEPGPLVVSVYARTDPRDPANTSASPAWHVALRDGLSALGNRLEADGDRDTRLAFRALRTRIEDELVEMEPAARARSVALFVDVNGGRAERFSLQLPVRADMVVGDRRPFVSPLVDIADRGASTGVILASGETVRLLQIEQGEVAEPANSTFELTLGDWRPFAGSAGGSPGPGQAGRLPPRAVRGPRGCPAPPPLRGSGPRDGRAAARARLGAHRARVREGDRLQIPPDASRRAERQGDRGDGCQPRRRGAVRDRRCSRAAHSQHVARAHDVTRRRGL